MIYAYGDDGSDQKKQRVLAVSIIAGFEDDWKSLEAQWVDRCGGVPFHATDCESDQGDYKDTPHKNNKAMYRDLTEILATSKVSGIGIAIDLGAIKAIFGGIPPLPYYQALIQCLTSVANGAEYFSDTCKVIYDIGKSSEYNAAQLYAALRENDERLRRFLHPELSFVPWRDSARVQTSDLLAYEAWKALDHTVGDTKRQRKSWEALRATKRFEVYSYSTDYYRDLKRHLDSGALERRIGFNESGYQQWLVRKKRQHNMTNLILFLRSEDEHRFLPAQRTDDALGEGPTQRDSGQARRQKKEKKRKTRTSSSSGRAAGRKG